MPEFENFENYHSRRPDGSVKVSPIAPHSLQPVEYTPNSARRTERSKSVVPKVPKTNIEPVDIRQMEKEFRQANRENRPSFSSRLRAGIERLKRRLAKWFKSSKAKRGKPTAGKPYPPKNNRRRKDDRKTDPTTNRGPQGENANAQGSGQRKRRRRPKNNRGGNPAANQGGNQGGPAPQQSGQSDDKPNNRNRPRGRSRTGKDSAPKDSSNGDSGNSENKKDGPNRPRKRRSGRNRRPSNPENPS